MTEWLLLFGTSSSLFSVSTKRPFGESNPVAIPDNTRIGPALPVAVRG